MKTRKPCRWKGCMEPRKAGRGCSYCKEHATLALKKKREKDRRMWRKRAKPSSKAIEIIPVESDPAHELAVRMLAGKA